MKKRQLKWALVNSVVSLILCCVMLAGTTYAWMSESINVVNSIQTGNLDVMLEYWDGDEWKPVQDEEALTELFHEKVWQSGEIRYLTLRINNIGSLPFTYQLMAGPDVTASPSDAEKELIIEEMVSGPEEEGPEDEEAEGDDMELLRHFQVGYIEGFPIASSSNAMGIEDEEIQGMESLADGLVIEGELEGSELTSEELDLDPEEGEIITLVIYVPEISLSDVNWDEETEQKKLFGVKFVAVQLTDEEETFSENLDQPEEGGPGVKTADKEENES